MGSIAIDNPDCIIDWFPCYRESERKRPIIGDCPHACRHRMTKVVGWGPDLRHYELHICKDPDGCRGNCRGWMAGTGATSYQLLRRINWKHLGALPQA